MTGVSLGFFLHNTHIATDPALLAEVAVMAEELGYDSLWAPEHVVVPSPRVAPSPMEPDDPILDPLVVLAHLAARTSTIRLGTGVIVLPQRNPLVLAKQVASLDVLCGGRVLLGIGAGYLEPELRAIGVPLDERGKRTDEFVAAMRALWTADGPVAFTGTTVAFEGVAARPRPVQRPVPLVVGGESGAAHRRTARDADGWYGFRLSPETVAEQVAGLRAAATRIGRERPIHISATPDRKLDTGTVAEYAAAGAQRLIVAPPPSMAPDRLLRFVEANAPAALDAKRA
ncbi:LLM class F420-dependent oxidoreductase [Actinomycetes bacterium KLBMP 9759]